MSKILFGAPGRVPYFQVTRLAAFFSLFLLPPLYAQNAIELYYEERAPYAVRTDTDGVTGLTASVAAEAFARAQIEFDWKRMPFKRQLETIKYNKKQACGIGWFKNPERAVFARYTHEIYQDRPTITLSQRSNTAVASHKDIISLLMDSRLRLLVKGGFSYGPHIDKAIRQYAPKTVEVAGSSNTQMLQMVLGGRADYFFISEEEAEQIILSSGYTADQFHLQRYKDLPPGNSRYVACSLQVPESTIRSINEQLAIIRSDSTFSSGE